ncbi:MAG: FAD-dependent oxidoreductase [Planctomycetota bacterium]
MNLNWNLKRMLCVVALWAVAWAGAREVMESARTLPVAADVDVLVVGGGVGGVAAAVEAAAKGAKVYLAAPRSYLGEDICETYRLWLEPGETPTTDLAKEMFQAAAQEAKVSAGVKFSYTTDRKSFTKHADTTPPSRLSDGKWGDAATESVQFNGDVAVTCDFGKPVGLKALHLMAFQRPNDFEIESLVLSISDDGKIWKPFSAVKNDKRGLGKVDDKAFDLAAPLVSTTRFVNVLIKKTAESDRVLLGDLVFESDAPSAPVAAVATANTPVPATPMQIKRTLDQALIKANVTFLYGCYPTEVLRDAKGRPAGVVFANRSGRQAVIAKVIIDTTARGIVARLAGAAFNPYPNGTQEFRFNVVGGAVVKNDAITVRERPNVITVRDTKGGLHPITEYSVKVAMKDDSFGSFAAAEQIARDLTWNKQVVDASETPYQVAPDGVVTDAPFLGPWQDAEGLNLRALQPKGFGEIFVLGSCADVSRSAAADLIRPLNIMAVGTRVGAAAAEVAAKTSAREGVIVPGRKSATVEKNGDVREVQAFASPRYASSKTIQSEASAVPVIGEYDVVVVGGGTGGAPAAISAGRQGSKTLMVEYLHTLGGVGTTGLISIYYHGNKVGFTHEADVAIEKMQGTELKTKAVEWMPDVKAEWYRNEMRKNGVDIWCGTLGAGAYVENGKVRGVVIATPFGRGVVLAKVVIDSTGNADIAAAAGAECTYTAESEVAVQGTGLPPRNLAPRYLNTDYTYVDETDVFDIWRAFVMGRQKYKSAYDLGQLIDTRERRRIVGDVEISPLDATLSRTWPDTVVISDSNFDSHGYTIHPLFLLRAPDKKAIKVPVPYRALLPRGVDGILVTGLGVSAHRDTLPLIRMQADIQNQGYAAGIAASMASKANQPLRSIDVKALQKQLVDIGNLPGTVLTEKDSFPLPKERYVQAIKDVVEDFKSLDVLLTDPDISKPLLRNALAATGVNSAQRRTYAHILGMLGDPAAADALIEEIKVLPWDKGWQFKGMGQFGASVSPLDSLIIALGRTGDKRAAAVITEKATTLKPDSEFSHFRAVSLALDQLADPIAAKTLSDLLKSPGISGHAASKIGFAVQNIAASGTDEKSRSNELIELNLARALFRCGDLDGLGEKTLKEYAGDFHGHYARHAQAILNSKNAKKDTK